MSFNRCCRVRSVQHRGTYAEIPEILLTSRHLLNGKPPAAFLAVTARVAWARTLDRVREERAYHGQEYVPMPPNHDYTPRTVGTESDRYAVTVSRCLS